jgi:hypothetical protein
MSYPTECKHCKKYQWPDKYCCKANFRDRTDNSVLIDVKPIRYNHESVYFVPVFQKNFKDDGTPEYSPTFTYSFELCTSDEQMAWSFEPDYVLVLKGTFDATTQPFIIKGDEDDKSVVQTPGGTCVS